MWFFFLFQFWIVQMRTNLDSNWGIHLWKIHSVNYYVNQVLHRMPFFIAIISCKLQFSFDSLKIIQFQNEHWIIFMGFSFFLLYRFGVLVFVVKDDYFSHFILFLFDYLVLIFLKLHKSTIALCWFLLIFSMVSFF